MGEDFSLCEGPMDPRTDVVLKTQEGVGWPSKPDVAALLPYLVDELLDHRFGLGSAHVLPVSGSTRATTTTFWMNPFARARAANLADETLDFIEDAFSCASPRDYPGQQVVRCHCG